MVGICGNAGELPSISLIPQSPFSFSLPGRGSAPISCAIMDARKDLVGLSRDELAAEMKAMGAEPFRARQLWHWIYNRGVSDFAAMTTLAKSFRAELAERYVVGRPGVARALASVDGARKWLLRFADGQEV